jgi:hypothetical protein
VHLADLVVVWLRLRLSLLSFLCVFFKVAFMISYFYHLFLLQDSDVANDDVIASPLKKSAPQNAAVDQDEELRKSVVDSSEVGAESTGEDHSSSDDSFFDSAPNSAPEEQIVSAESTSDDDDMLGADDSSMGPAESMEEDLAIIPHAGHGCDDDSTVDADVDPISFSVPQTVLSSRVTGMIYPVLISLSCANEKYTYAYHMSCTLICRRP